MVLKVVVPHVQFDSALWFHAIEIGGMFCFRVVVFVFPVRCLLCLRCCVALGCFFGCCHVHAHPGICACAVLCGALARRQYCRMASCGFWLLKVLFAFRAVVDLFVCGVASCALVGSQQ